MSFRRTITDFVRLGLYRSAADHPLRRAYGMVRSLPGVRQIWRSIDAGAIAFPETIDSYIARGGFFGSGTAPAGHAHPPVVAFDHADFFSNLIERIEACEPRCSASDTNIVLVNNGLSAGGAERQIVHTLLGLKKRNVPAILIGEYLNAPGLDFHLDTVRSAGVDVQQLRNYTQPGKRLFESVSRPVAEQLLPISEVMLFEMLDMVRMLRAIRPSVVHLWQDETSVRHAISALIAGVPRIIVSGRNLNPTHFAYYRPYLKTAYLALRASPRVIFSNNSLAGARSYADWLGMDASAIRVVHNGQNFSAWPRLDQGVRNAMRQELGVEDDATLVLGVFRLSEEKRPLLWIETAAHALKSRPDLRFAIAGDGPMREAVVAGIERLGVAGRIKLVGERQDVSSLYMACEAFMLASAQEGLPNVLLEAQWYGCPILTTQAGGASEAVDAGKTGRISAANSAPELAADLLALLADDKLRLSARTSGPAFVERAFGAERMVDETLRLYGLG